MTKTYVLSTAIGQVRLKIGDNVAAAMHFEDEELQVFLTDNGNSVLLAAAAALESWAASYATNPNQESIGGYSYSQDVTKKMRDLAAQYREEAVSAPATAWAEMDLTS